MIEECLVVEFAVTGDDCPLATASGAAGVDVDARPPQLRRDGNALLRFGASRADADDLAAELDADDRVRYLHRTRGDGGVPGARDGGRARGGVDDGRVRGGRDGGRARGGPDDGRVRSNRDDGRVEFRCLSKHPCVVHELTDVGFLAEALQYRDGTERYVGAVVGRDVLQGVLAAAGETVGVTLQRVHPLGEEGGSVATRWDLTPAQTEALRAALEAGYFRIPRDVTAAEVAAELGIGKSAFLERLRRGQGALLAQVFG